MRNETGNVFSAAGTTPMVFVDRTNQNNEQPGGADSAAVASNAKLLPETYDDSVYLDSDLVAERNYLKSRIPRSDANVVCVASGGWSDINTWYNTDTADHRLPASGDKVLIPIGFNVTFDLANGAEADVDWIRLDGAFDFDTTADRTLEYETFFIDHSGRLEIGSEASPVPATTNIRMQVPDTGDMNVASDPAKMGRGLVCFDGAVEIVGAPKAEYARAATDLLATETSVTLNEAKNGLGIADGWRVGDELVITGTIMHGWGPANIQKVWEDWENEVVTITAIDTSNPAAPIVTFHPALIYDHVACWKRPNLTCHVLNMTRNVKFGPPAGVVPAIQQRAHNLFKSDTPLNIKNTEFRHLGRTDHSVMEGQGELNPVNAPGFIQAGGTVTPETNFTGRYPCHLHRSGFDSLEGAPHVMEGLVIVDGPAWGGVHHDSFANWSRCIAYDCKSAGFAAEGGGNIGTWKHMFACGSKPSYRNYAVAKTKDGGADFGQLGNGYWINSRTLKVQECIACNANNGFAWTSRQSFGTNVYPGVTDEVTAFYGLTEDPTTTVARSFAVIQGFKNNEAYACGFGMSVVKSQPNQHHDLRSFFDGFIAWEVQIGAHLGYTAHYSLVNFDVIGFNPAPRNTNGTRPFSADRGISIAAHDMDMIVNQPRIEEFGAGIGYATNSPYALQVNRGNVIIEPTMVNVAEPYDIYNEQYAITSFPYSFTEQGSTYDDIIYIAAANLPPAPGGGNISYDWRAVEDKMVWIGGQNNFMLFGELTDSLGVHHRYLGRPNPPQAGGLTVIDEQSDIYKAGKVTSNFGILVLVDQYQMEALIRSQGVYTSAAGDKVLLIPDVAQDRLDGSTTYFWSPVALRMPASKFSAFAPADNGPLADGPGEEFEGFAPAGTPGLT